MPRGEPRLTQLAPRLRAREGIRARQVLLNPDQTTGTAAFKDESISGIRDEANKALLSTQGTPGYRVKAVTKLRNGGILLELDSDEAAEWFQDPEIHRTFLSHLHRSIAIKPRLYNIVVQFVPLTLHLEREVDLREIEEVNGLDEGDILKARWIKLIACRSPSQTCGHVIVSFSSPIPANDALANGLFVCHKKVYTEKCKKEPLCCLKCHSWNHLATNCPQQYDTCGTCSQRHHTSTYTNLDKPHCSSCGLDDHPSWDRACPTFCRKCAELNERAEENRMLYFPTLKTWTQVLEPTRPPHALGSPSAPTPAPTWRGAPQRPLHPTPHPMVPHGPPGPSGQHGVPSASQEGRQHSWDSRLNNEEDPHPPPVPDVQYNRTTPQSAEDMATKH